MAENRFELKSSYYNPTTVEAIPSNGRSSGGEVSDELDDEYPRRGSKYDEGHTANDQRDMKRMGKQQELMRNFRLISSIGFTSCVMGTWELLYTQNTQALIDGGKAGMFWGYVWVYIGQTFIVLSLAEMSSMAPTAGGQYHWVSEFAPSSYQKVLSYASGWLSTLCWQCFVAADGSIVANIIVALISINNPNFVPKPWMTTVLLIGVIISMALINIYGARKLPLLEGIFITIHVFFFFPVIVILWVMVPKASASEVFLNFSDNGGSWPTMGLALMVGQVSAMYTVQASDSVAHMSEEIKDASKVAPRAMLSAYLLNVPFAFGILITFLFTVGDLDVVLDITKNPTGFPFIYPILVAVGPAGATGISVIMLLLIYMITLSCMASTSRQTFAFARDNGLPFPRWMSRVSPRWKVPANSVWFTAAFTIVLSLIYLGSTTAFNAFVSVSIVAIMATYAISIGCVLLRRIRANRGSCRPLPDSRFNLGKWGVPVNTIALVYCIYSFFWCFWPIVNSAAPVSFNWAIVIFGFVMIASVIAYFAQARKTYAGPVAQTEGYIPGQD